MTSRWHRQVLAVTLVSLISVGLGLAYCVRRAVVRSAAMCHLNSVGGVNTVEGEAAGRRSLASPLTNPVSPSIVQRSLESVSSTLQSHVIATIALHSEITDETVAAILQFSELNQLSFYRSTVNDKQLGMLGSIQKLTSLNLGETTITDKSVFSFVVTQNNLQSLHLSGTAISDAGVKSLVKLSRLSWLELENTQITDASAASLAQIKSLKVLRIRGTRLTDSGLQKLTALSGLQQLYAGHPDGDSGPVTIRTQDWFYYQLPSCSLIGSFAVPPDYKSNITVQQRSTQYQNAVCPRIRFGGRLGGASTSRIAE